VKGKNGNKVSKGPDLPVKARPLPCRQITCDCVLFPSPKRIDPGAMAQIFVFVAILRGARPPLEPRLSRQSKHDNGLTMPRVSRRNFSTFAGALLHGLHQF
jgi:hypothetical protein